MMKHHHSDLVQRSLLLLLALTGNVGRRGAGVRIGAWYMMSSLEPLLAKVKPAWWQKLLLRVYRPTVRELISYFRDYEREHMYMNIPALLFLYYHGGLKELVDRPTGGHTRWSIHSTFRDEVHMLRLQRGAPVAYLNPEDAAARGIRDHDRIRVFNDVGSCELAAKISPSVQPGQVIVYHAWEPFQFPEWRSPQDPVPSPWKSLHLASYGQLHYRFLYAGPHHAPRATAVEVARA